MSLKKLFGKNITPDCEYCLYYQKNANGQAVCRRNSRFVGKVCGRYAYDPLKREPRATPAIPEFTADDFKL